MTELKYKYLFPYEKVPRQSKIIIYGAGTLGQDYYLQLLITRYCEVVGFIDRNYAYYQDWNVPIYAPEDICRLDFDYVVVAIRMEAAFNEIKRVLKNCGIPNEKIVAIFEREYNEKNILKTPSVAINYAEVIKPAHKSDLESIAILTTGGYGDMIIQKRLIMEIVKLLPNCGIDIYNIKSIDLLKTLYTDIPNIRNIIPDLGTRYLQSNCRYKLSFTIEACHFIKVDYWDREFWNNDNRLFFSKLEMLIQKTKEEAANILMPPHVTLYRRWIKGYNAYSGFNYDGVFDVADKIVNIPLDISAEMTYRKLRDSWKAHRYITINCGNGDCADNSLVAKSWPMKYYDNLVQSIAKEYPDLHIVQLGQDNADKIKNCDEYLLGRSLSLVEYVLKNSFLHIDIEGGLVHIASQLGTKCVVLFGPTVVEYYGYENNINIRAGNCHNCWGLYSDVNRCARGMKEPECMYSITPQIVYGYIKKELDRL